MTSSLTPEENLDFVDENEEWAKIEKVMASLDTGLATDVLDDEGIGNILESGSNSMPVESVVSNGEVQLFTNNSFVAYDRALTDWLSDQGLSKYEHFLISNGFDDMRFMGPEIMSEGDLIEIGMCDAEERARLIQASQQLTNNADVGDQLTTSSSFKSVKHWLTSLNLSDYYETFAVHGCSALEDLLNIWDLQLTSVFHISRLGHRNRIMASINSFRSHANSKTSKSDSITNGCHDSLDIHNDESQSLKSAPQNICLTEYLLQRHHNLTNHNNNNNSNNIGEVSLFKDYSSLRSNKSGRSSASSTLRRQGEDQDSRRESKVITLEEVLRNCGVLEPTVKVMTPSSSNASATSLPTSSNNRQLDLVLDGSNQQIGHSSFSVTYLGTVKLLSIERPDLARKCIEQIRQTPVESRRVVITISHKQVIFRDQISQEVLGAHDVNNVFCVCQDSELLEYFAFVTWDVIESVHFCHVFNAQYIKLSTDVVLALGKAFEVAFKIIQQEVAKQNGRSLSSSSASPSSPSTAIATTAVVATPATAALRPQTATEKKSTFV